LARFADDKTFDSTKLQAWHERIGNIATVAFLEEENQESLLSTKVVYSGSHAGDFIPFSETPQLEQEVNQLEARSAETRSPELTTFSGQMRRLIAAASREHNAMVF
jgi:hypothetical protein